MNKKILCFGDSITEGHPGVTYLKYFTNKNQYKNFGLSGDTLIGMKRRLIKVLESNKYKDVTGIIVGIGGNDVIQPFLKNYSWMWKLRVKMLLKRGSIPCSSVEQFKEEYTELIKILKNSNKKVLIFSIPYFETKEGNLNKTVKEYNKIIEELCKRFDIPFVNYYSWQEQKKIESKNTNYAFMSKNPLLVGLDIVLTSYLQLASYISKKRKLELTVDGCHLNNYTSKSLAVLIEEKYNEIKNQDK